MPNAREDHVAIEAAADLLAEGLNKGDVSSLADLVTEQTVVMPPARATFRGRAVFAFWRNLALRVGGVRLLSTHLDSIGDDVVRDIGTLSLRPRQGERVYFRYLILWHRIGPDWKLASMTWNRDAGEAAPGRGEPEASASGTGPRGAGMDEP